MSTYKVDLILTGRTAGKQDEGVNASVSGWAPALPEVGQRFMMYSDPKGPADVIQYTRTSPVIYVSEPFGSRLSFKTENSVYTLRFQEIP